MITRLWFVLSVGWAALFFWNCTTRTVFKFDGVDAILVFGPFLMGLALKLVGRYVMTGSVRPRPGPRY
jgi:hypothetical protein